MFQFDCCVLLLLLLLLLATAAAAAFFILHCCVVMQYKCICLFIATHIRHYERQRSTYFRSGKEDRWWWWCRYSSLYKFFYVRLFVWFFFIYASTTRMFNVLKRQSRKSNRKGSQTIYILKRAINKFNREKKKTNAFLLKCKYSSATWQDIGKEWRREEDVFTHCVHIDCYRQRDFFFYSHIISRFRSAREHYM